MFNVGGMELLVIAVVALVVLGPDKLPGALRQFGTVVGELRRTSSRTSRQWPTAPSSNPWSSTRLMPRSSATQIMTLDST